MKKGKILVVGSVVFDTIKRKEFYGGCGANIAYGLGSLGVRPMLFSLAGNDFPGSYEKHLKRSGIDLRIHIDKKNKTARYYDFLESSQKRRNWFPNAYKNIAKISIHKIISKKDLENVTFAICSSSTSESAIKHMQELKNYSPRAVVIFDPGPIIYDFSKKGLEKCINICDIFIVNEMEYRQAKKILGSDPRKIIRNKIIIETQSEKGSLIFQNGEKIKIPAVLPKRVLDTTGAGDAYRAGLLFGLHRGKSLVKSCYLGAEIASRSIECVGCQTY